MPHRLDPLLHGLVEAHRAGDAELAGVGARAADHVGDLLGARRRRGRARSSALPDVVDRLVAHPAQHQVLAAPWCGRSRRSTRASISARPRNCSGVRSPRVTLHLRPLEKPSWRCGVDVGRARSGRTRGGRRWACRRWRARPARSASSSCVEAAGRACSRARSTQSPFSSSSTWSRKLVDADLVDQHLDARAGAVVAQQVLAVEDAQARPR